MHLRAAHWTRREMVQVRVTKEEEMKNSRVDERTSVRPAVATPTPYFPIVMERGNGPDRPNRDPINMLVARPVADAFKQFCKIERYRYNEALEVIMKRAGLLPADFDKST